MGISPHYYEHIAKVVKEPKSLNTFLAFSDINLLPHKRSEPDHRLILCAKTHFVFESL